jgi:ATP synthase protein I
MVRAVHEGRDETHPQVRFLVGPRPHDLLLVAAAAICFCGACPEPPSRGASWGDDMPDGPDEAEELKARLAKLRGDLQARRDSGQREAERKAEADLTDKGLGRAMSLGFRVLSEFVAAIVVGALIGWQIDQWLGTSPALLILFLGFGVAAGFWNIFRLAAPPKGRNGR